MTGFFHNIVQNFFPFLCFLIIFNICSLTQIPFISASFAYKGHCKLWFCIFYKFHLTFPQSDRLTRFTITVCRIIIVFHGVIIFQCLQWNMFSKSFPGYITKRFVDHSQKIYSLCSSCCNTQIWHNILYNEVFIYISCFFLHNIGNSFSAKSCRHALHSQVCSEQYCIGLLCGTSLQAM